ncbi:hypothetical protein EFT58_11100 [Lactococcus lactis]|uniref:hypothetical protein n=1 Tax=Lactococcus lactis TaxID=1358 RepID=UPI001455FCC4|nr:hypothetical protein [Lactococcus lactis]MCT0437778.1 hypothetical protein [Lactococcus lactis subsp. lactis]MCT2921101.1 hypothetical protein [Lactococcus lactis]NLS46697.1 hypothetical protein [Lactococcus lactis]
MHTLIKNSQILFLCLLGISIFGALGFGLYFLFFTGVSNQWVWASVLLIIFIIITWFSKKYVDWKHGGILLVLVIAFMGACIDIQGNPLYNEPIRLVYQHLGTLKVKNIMTSINGTTGVNYYFNIVNPSGHIVKQLNMWGVALFRFIEYLVIYSILLSMLVPMFKSVRNIKLKKES